MKKLKLRIHPVGLLVLVFAVLFEDSHLVLAAFLAFVLHEGAHLLAMHLLGIRECAIEITPFGGIAETHNFDSFSPLVQMLSAAAGILASGVLAWLCWRFAPHTVFWRRFTQANLSLAVVNSLPAWPLDGARVLTALFAWLGHANKAKKVMSCVSQLVGISLMLAGLFGVWHGMINPLLLLCGPYLCYAARAESLADRIRLAQFPNRKLDHHTIVPVSFWAGSTEDIQAVSGVMVGKAHTERYHVLLQIDQETGRIKKAWTESELFNEVFDERHLDG